MILKVAQLNAQKDTSSLLAMVGDGMDNGSRLPVKATFKGTYILNTASIENVGKGVLQVMIMHRFGKISDGAYELFGLDNATIRLGLDYGITERLMVTIGRSSFEKVFDGSIKYRILRQTSGNSMPVSLSLNTGLTYTTLRYPDKPYMNETFRTDYFTQLLLARKFSSNFSLQLTPSWIHQNLVPDTLDKNNQIVLGAGGRIKLTKRLSINAEYNYLFPNQVVTYKVYNSFSAGLDIETGGHVFQFVFSNSRGMVPPVFLTNTTDSWRDGGIYFGFNISRVFTVRK
ncbi:DUF5777 family beta-barrel protein [Flavihumibacter fluvii]|uniref:DUF5777 family beta-barrel protein n=1 Tax=Flavihumibacter fluvii TaxID=2838157 RepID=UPI001BDED3DD|nr:DUF5777 family beta-barrel protein [Flavihumibacter fluvii]ULQ53443.1 DUF5777 family beta-barrel protein [Flavihumibacter fluvii]